MFITSLRCRHCLPINKDKVSPTGPRPKAVPPLSGGCDQSRSQILLGREREREGGWERDREREREREGGWERDREREKRGGGERWMDGWIGPLKGTCEMGASVLSASTQSGSIV